MNLCFTHTFSSVTAFTRTRRKNLKKKSRVEKVQQAPSFAFFHIQLLSLGKLHAYLCVEYINILCNMIFHIFFIIIISKITYALNVQVAALADKNDVTLLLTHPQFLRWLFTTFRHSISMKPKKKSKQTSRRNGVWRASNNKKAIELFDLCNINQFLCIMGRF